MKSFPFSTFFYAGYYLSGLNSQSEQTRSSRVGDENTPRLGAVLHKLERPFNSSTVCIADQRVLELLLQFQKESWDKNLVLILHASLQRLWLWEMFDHNVGTICLERERSLLADSWEILCCFSRCISKMPERSNSWDETLILAHGSKCFQSSVVGRHGPGCGSDLVARACGYTKEQRTGPRTWVGGNL